MGGKSSNRSATTNTQQTTQTQADLVTGGVVASGENTIVNEFNQDVASAFNALINLTGDVATGAGDLVSKSVDAVSDTTIATTQPEVQQTRDLVPFLVTGVLGLAAVGFAAFWRK